MFCSKHPGQQATGRFRVHFGRKTQKRFKTFAEAERFLDGVRYEVDRGTFDPRDYQKGNPLGFSVLSEKWLKVKQREVSASTNRCYANYMRKACAVWASMNVKKICYSDLEDFLFDQDCSDKTRADIRACLHTFWKWLLKRKIISIQQFPEFPTIKYNLAFRNLIDKDTQNAIIEEVKRLTFKQNPKVWLGIKWLATYIAIRPNEMLNLTEKDIDYKTGYFYVRKTKEGKVKIVPMLQEDIEYLKKMPIGLPDLPFFRHVGGYSGFQGGKKFGSRYFYKTWIKACKNLGIENIDLYGGTRHSTATALRKFLSPEQIKAGTMHSTNKAFDRYLQIQNDDALSVYELARSGKRVSYQNGTSKKSNVP